MAPARAEWYIPEAQEGKPLPGKIILKESRRFCGLEPLLCAFLRQYSQAAKSRRLIFFGFGGFIICYVNDCGANHEVAMSHFSDVAWRNIILGQSCVSASALRTN
jgi:hypothetical protein